MPLTPPGVELTVNYQEFHRFPRKIAAFLKISRRSVYSKNFRSKGYTKNNPYPLFRFPGLITIFS